MKVREQALIKYHEEQGLWEVNIGVTVPFRNERLVSCKHWCEFRSVPIRNIDEVNRILYNNMPQVEQEEVQDCEETRIVHEVPCCSEER